MAKVTLKDIAREAGVAPSTASLVLNGRPVRVSPETRRRIQDCARRLRYVPNQMARSLATHRSNTMGLIVPNIESRFFSSLARNLEQRCRHEGYALLIASSDGAPETDVDLVGLFVNRGVDGVFIVVARELDADPHLVEALSQLPVPYVMVDRFVDGAPGDRVRFDNRMGGHIATWHLLQRGHRRIAIVANRRAHTGRERLAGYETALREMGVEVDPALELQSDYYLQEAYQVADRLLDLAPTAVVATSDNIALGLLKRLHERGVRVPDDLSIVSYDNSAADFLFEPALTAIDQDVGELSDAALAVMLRRLGERDAGGGGGQSAPVERLLSPRLVERGSVRPV